MLLAVGKIGPGGTIRAAGEEDERILRLLEGVEVVVIGPAMAYEQRVVLTRAFRLKLEAGHGP